MNRPGKLLRVTMLATAVALVAGAARAGIAASAVDASVPADGVSPAQPRVPFALLLDIDTAWHRGDGYQTFTRDDAHGEAGLSMMADALRIGRRVTLAAGIGWLNETLEGYFAGGHATELVSNSYSGSIAVRYTLKPWLEPYLQVSGEAARARVEVRTPHGQTLRGHDWVSGGRAGAGVRFRTLVLKPRGKSLGFLRAAFAASLEGGYALGSPFEFSVRPPRPSDDQIAKDQIPFEPVPLGELSRAHPYMRVSLGVLF